MRVCWRIRWTRLPQCALLEIDLENHPRHHARFCGGDADIPRRSRRQQRDTILVPDPQGSPGAEQEVERREEQTAVRAALARLTQRQVQLLLLRQMDFTYAECAAVCDVAPGSVGTLLARAARDFRAAYEEVVASEARHRGLLWRQLTFFRR